MRDLVKNSIEPSVSHRFAATFFLHAPVGFIKIPSLIDVNFQSISGLGLQMEGESFHEGGDSVSQIYLPKKVNHGNLVLRRGVMKVTPVSAVFQYALNSFRGVYFDVVIMLFDHRYKPVCYWTATDAQPVKWEPGELDANSNQVLVNTIELAYRELTWAGKRR
jgi:phage tail-like protein